MNQLPYWHFPSNNYTRPYGFDTSDMETFKKDPIALFAREVCQNSIDAHRNGSAEPVRIEFKTFTIFNSKVPGIMDLKNEMNHCRNYLFSENNKKEEKIANEIYENINGDIRSSIQCLRVSDYNTTGLYGAESHKITEPFYALTRGSGVSSKGAGMAGSKGIGKYAAFVISKTNTVFYSTHALHPDTNDIEDAYLGVTKLCSTPLDDEGLFTAGEGFYGLGEQIFPVLEQLNLDPSFRREDDEFGTDLFIVGFKEKNGWKEEILKKVLESFLVAIMNKSLEVNVDGIEVNNLTLGSHVDKIRNQSYLSTVDKSIVSQFDILAHQKDETIHTKTIKIHGDEIKLFARVYSGNDAQFATRKCTFVRYPYMKIVEKQLNAMAPVSAMCIIEKNNVNDILRSIENPQHTAWEKNRVRDDKELSSIVNEILDGLTDGINAFVTDIVGKNEGDSTDLEGAGEFLPDEELLGGKGENEGGDEAGDEGTAKEDITLVSTPTRRGYRANGGGVETSGPEGEPSTVQALGEEDENGTTVGTPINQGEPGTDPNPPTPPNPPRPEPKVDEEDIKIYGPGFKPYMRHILSNNMRFRCMKPIDAKDSYEVMFSANTTENDCELRISSIGDSNDIQRIDIKSAIVDGKEVEVKFGRIVHFPIEKGKSYRISCKTNRDELFASKVEMYAIKK